MKTRSSCGLSCEVREPTAGLAAAAREEGLPLEARPVLCEGPISRFLTSIWAHRCLYFT